MTYDIIIEQYSVYMQYMVYMVYMVYNCVYYCMCIYMLTSITSISSLMQLLDTVLRAERRSQNCQVVYALLHEYGLVEMHFCHPIVGQVCVYRLCVIVLYVVCLLISFSYAICHMPYAILYICLFI
jgi:hypothetical protein